MKATTLLQTAYIMSLTNYRAEADRWVTIVHRLASVAGNAHSLSVSSVGKLDVLLRQLESEHLEELANGGSLATDLIGTLSDSWLLASYEPIRAACEHLKSRSERNDKLTALHRRLALARIPVAKAEIKDAQRRKPDLVLYPVDDDGGDSSGKSYTHDGSYIRPRGVCSETGATVWYPIDLNESKTVAICRRDLSDEFLRLFD